MERIKANLPIIILGCAILIGLVSHLLGQRPDERGGLAHYTLADRCTHRIELTEKTTIDVYRVAGEAVHSYLVCRWSESGQGFYKVVDALPGVFHSVRTVSTDERDLLGLVYERASGERVMRLYRFSDRGDAAGGPEISAFSRDEIVSEWDFHTATCSIASSGADSRGGSAVGTTYNYLSPYGIDTMDKQLPVAEFINSPEDYLCIRKVSDPLAAVEMAAP